MFLRSLAALAGLLLWIGSALAQQAPFVLGTSQDADTLAGKMQRRIYGEAFSRLGMPLQLVVMPLQRLSAATDQGQIDGDVARVHGYANAHPELVRVEEPVYDVIWALYATNPALRLDRAEDLRSLPLRATFLRGAAVCERALKALMPPERLMDVTSDQQGFSMLRLGRSDLHCTADLSAITLQHSAEFRGIDILRRVADIGTFALHTYLHRRHAELAPRLGAVLRQMRAEGLIERYRAEAVRELGPR